MRYCIGDVHACSHELKLLLELIHTQDSEAKLYSVGDFINKGPNNLEVLELFEEYKIQAIRGNHEDGLLRLWNLLKESASQWVKKGEDHSTNSFKLSDLESFVHDEAFCEFLKVQQGLRNKDVEFLQSFHGLLHQHVDWIEKLPYWLDLEDILMVHAGLIPGQDHLEEMNSRILTTIRTWDGDGADLKNPDNPSWFELVSWPKPIVFGHWAQKGLVDQPLFKGLDTGCVYGKKLTAWCIENDQFYQVQAQKVYCAI